MFWVLIIVIALILLWLWTICPNLRRKEITRGKLQRHYAHRGLHDKESPENSMMAFRKAKEKGWGIELDIRLTSDRKVIVMHDRNLLRATGVNKNIDETTYEELRNLTIFKTNERIPLFSEVLEEMKDVPLLVEFKGEVNGKELCPAAAELLDTYHRNYIIESFNPLIVRWFKKNRPEVIRGQLSTRFRKEELSLLPRISITNLLTNHFARPDFIAYDINHQHQPGFLISRYLYRTPALGWTVHPETREISEKKYDGIIYEND